MGTGDDVFASPHVVRFPDESAYDVELVESVAVRYFDYIDKGVLPPPVIIEARARAAPINPDTRPLPTAGGGYAPRRFRINKSDLEKFGFTNGCPGCIATQSGDPSRRGVHTEDCRKRISGQITDDRVERETQRIDQWVAVQGEPKTDAGGQKRRLERR